MSHSGSNFTIAASRFDYPLGYRLTSYHPLHPDHVECLSHLSPDPYKTSAFHKSVLFVEGQAGMVERGYTCQDSDDPHFPSLVQEAVKNLLADSCAGVLRRDEIGNLRRPGKGRQRAVRAQTSKANDFAARFFGCEERIATGQTQEGREELVRDLALRIGGKAVLHVVVVDVDYLIAIFGTDRFQLVVHNFFPRPT